MALTGVTSSLLESQGTLKFTSTEAWKITRIGGLQRSVAVIDDSHLGLTQYSAKLYCFGDLVDLSPMSIDVHIDPDNTDIFEASSSTNSPNNAMETPIPLGVNLNTNVVTTVTNFMVLTLPSTNTTAASLTISGAFISDSGFELVNNDRPRSTLQFHPDGRTFIWGVASS